MKKGIDVHRILDSNIFLYKFEFEEWPQAHSDLRKLIVPYNGSIFEIRNNYETIFPDLKDPFSDSGFSDNVSIRLMGLN